MLVAVRQLVLLLIVVGAVTGVYCFPFCLEKDTVWGMRRIDVCEGY